ncbi:MAG: protein-glutamine glutaminase family protein [Flavobacterium sp.]|nr:protein-glutamine glutaminase family protein [Flavobacterium sp.]
MTHYILSKTTNRNLLAGQLPDHPVTLHFENNKTAILPQAHPMLQSWLKRIDFLQEHNRPVYINTDAHGIVGEVLMPTADSVDSIDESGSGAVAVAFRMDAAFYFLERDKADFAVLLAVLKDAKAKGVQVLVTATKPDYRIVAVEVLAGTYGKPALPHVPLSPSKFPKLNLEETVTPEKAQMLFDILKKTNCRPCHSVSPCIPFQYPGSGCWVRAHLMCFMLKGDLHVLPGKAWCYGTLNAHTVNDPNCKVSWVFHVAATVNVLQPKGRPKPMVLDPSMCEKPVTPEEWKAMMDTGNAELRLTDWHQYGRYGGEADLATAQSDIVEFRLLLDGMCAKDGPPPYAKCKL